MKFTKKIKLVRKKNEGYKTNKARQELKQINEAKH